MTPDELAKLKPLVTAAVQARGGVRRRTGPWWDFPCPNGTAHEHGDRTASAGWDEGRGVWKCLGCGLRGGAKDLAWRLDVPLPSRRERPVQQTTVFLIRDNTGAVAAEHHRIDFPPDRWCATHKKHCTKHLWWRLPNATRNGLGGRTVNTLPLYGVHELLDTAGGPVVVVEGEKARHALAARGIPAVGTVTGASTIPSDDVLRVLVGRDAVCWPDADALGRDTHMRPLVARLRTLGGTARWFDPWPESTDGRDAADFTGTTEELRALIGLAAPESTTAPTGPSPPLVGVLLADVESEAVHWLWHPRLPRGKLVLLVGDPDEGKSTIALDLAARVSTGAPMPLETVGRPAAGVVVLSAEDGLADTIRPRLEAAGADLSRIVSERLEALPTLDVAGIAHIRALIARVDAALVVLDPLMAFVPDAVDTHKDHHSRRLLRKLAALAEETGATVFVVRHPPKSPSANPKHAGGGSIGFTAAARVEHLAAPDPSDESRKVLARVKNNLAPPYPALGYRLVAAAGVVRIEWLGETTHTAAELLREPVDDDERTAGDEAEAWLRYFLADGPQPTKKVLRASDDAGIAERTLRRAKQRIGVKACKAKGTLEGNWCWALPAEPAASASMVSPARKAATEAEGCQGRQPGRHGSLRGSWQPSDGNGALGVVRCTECGGVGWEPDSSGVREYCANCGALSPISVRIEDTEAR